MADSSQPPQDRVSKDQPSTNSDSMASGDHQATDQACSLKDIKSITQTTISENDEERDGEDISQQRQIELEEERKLKAKHPSIQRPGSEFLQKRLQRGQKYFDSGDYNMAKASTNQGIKLPDGATPVNAIDSKLLNRRH